jgi:hypothetical protein
MGRRSVGRLVTGLAALAFLATAALHTSGYEIVTARAREAPAAVRALVPLLWLALSFDFTVLGLVVAVLAARPGPATRLVLAIVAIAPIAAAGLQVRFVGFIPPTAMLLGVAALTLLGAAILPAAGSEAAGGWGAPRQRPAR